MKNSVVFIDDPDVDSEERTEYDVFIHLKPEGYETKIPVVLGFSSSEKAERLGDACHRAAEFIRNEGRESVNMDEI